MYKKKNSRAKKDYLVTLQSEKIRTLVFQAFVIQEYLKDFCKTYTKYCSYTWLVSSTEDL